LSYAKSIGQRSGENPASMEALQHALPPITRVKKAKHHPALPVDDVPIFVGELRLRQGISARALLFTLLTAARSNEVYGAKWNEINGRVWTIPVERLKRTARDDPQPHRVPLVPAVIELLRGLPRTSEYIFPGARPGEPLSNMSMLQVMREIRPGYVPHGLRSSFKDWARKQGYAFDLSEMVLGHVIKGKSASACYQRCEFRRIEFRGDRGRV